MSFSRPQQAVVSFSYHFCLLNCLLPYQEQVILNDENYTKIIDCNNAVFERASKQSILCDIQQSVSHKVIHCLCNIQYA